MQNHRVRWLLPIGRTQVPALYLSNYSRAIDLADDLSLVRPDQSYRGAKDEECQELLDNPLAVYMVYTLEEGDERYCTQRIVARLESCRLFLISNDVSAENILLSTCVSSLKFVRWY